MFSNNQKISMRQTFRLFLFDFIGISTLVLPTWLAGTSGVYGVFSILLGGVFGLLYLLYLGWVLNRMQTDLFTHMSTAGGLLQKLLYGYLAVSCVLTSGFLAAVFTRLIRQSLIREESYALVLLLLLAVAGYAVTAGIESRARVYEVLFWFILIPLFLMLFFSLKGVDMIYFKPQYQAGIADICKGGYMVFLCFTTLFFVLFFPKYVRPESAGRRLISSVCWAFLCTIGILLALYLILLGTFGEGALAKMRFPAVTLMSTVQMTGGFLKRLDAIMMGIWFFTLFALLNLNLFYGAQMMEKCAGIPGNKRYAGMMLILTFLLAMLFEYTDGVPEFFYRFFWYVGTPLLILIPLIPVWTGRKRK